MMVKGLRQGHALATVTPSLVQNIYTFVFEILVFSPVQAYAVCAIDYSVSNEINLSPYNTKGMVEFIPTIGHEVSV